MSENLTLSLFYCQSLRLAFTSKLSPVLSKLFEEILSVQKLPSTMTQATIIVLPKKDKDPRDCGSYRPISLLCCDYKILAKILSRRLDPQ